MDEKIEAINMLFVLFSDNFIKELKSSALDKSLTDKERYELFEIVSQSIGRTIKDIMDEFNKEKIEGDRKDA